MNETEFINSTGWTIFARELECGSIYLSVFNELGQWLGSNVISSLVSQSIELKTSLNFNHFSYSEIFTERQVNASQD